jgi:hypothetical protein
VPIAWRYQTSEFDPISSFLASDANPMVDLLVDGQPYRIPPPSRTSPQRSFYVAVPGSPTRLRLTVEYDGVTQTLELGSGELDPGAAAGLYDLDEFDLTSRACRAGEWFDTTAAAARYTCEYVGPLLLPYANGSWAPEGQRWLAVQLSTAFTTYSTTDGVDGAHWTASGATTDLRLGQREPEAVRHTRGSNDICPDRREGVCYTSLRAFFAIDDDAPQRLRVTQEYDLKLHSSWGDYEPDHDRTAVASGTIALGR